MGLNFSNRYMFGFNGMEKDNEVKGAGNSYDFGARIYDSRLGRWLSLDPFASSLPSVSPYHFSNNSPIVFGDPDGKSAYPRHIRRALEMASDLHKGSVILHPDGRVVVTHQNAERVSGDLCGEVTVHSYSINIERTRMDKVIDYFSSLAGWAAGWDLFKQGEGHEVQYGMIITCHDRNGEGKNFGEEVTLAPGAAYSMVPLEAFEALESLDKSAQSAYWKERKATTTKKLNDLRNEGSKTDPKHVLDNKREGLDEASRMKVNPLSDNSIPKPDPNEYRKITYINQTKDGEERVTVFQRTPPGSNGQDSTVNRQIK